MSTYVKRWFKTMAMALWRMSLTQLLLSVIGIGLIGCLAIGIYVVHVQAQGDIVNALWKLDLWTDIVKYSPFILTALVSGIVGAKARIYMDEMKMAKNPSFAALSPDLKDRLLSEYGFARHNYLLGIVAAFVAIITLGEELSVLHQMVMGILSAMVGPQFLGQRLEGGGNDSPNLDIMQSSLDHLSKLDRLRKLAEEAAAGLENGGDGKDE